MGATRDRPRTLSADDVVMVPVAKLRPNPWNPNRMDEAALEAERESIDEHGFIVPVHVRRRGKTLFELIDGEHRWRVAKERELEAIPAVVLDVDDATAKRLTIILNDTRGEADPVALGALLNDLQRELGEGFAAGMRYEPAELRHLLSLGAEDWEALLKDPPDDGSHGDGDEWRTLTARLPVSVYETWSAVLGAIEEREEVELHDDAKVAAGQAIEVLVANYLAGA